MRNRINALPDDAGPTAVTDEMGNALYFNMFLLSHYGFRTCMMFIIPSPSNPRYQNTRYRFEAGLVIDNPRRENDMYYVP